MSPFALNLHLARPTLFEKHRLLSISAYNVSIVRATEKVQLWRIYEVDDMLSTEL